MRLKKKATVARRIRRMHSPGFKARVALEALRETRTMTQLCQEHDLHANQIIDWKRQLIEGATGVFGAPAAKAVGTSLKFLRRGVGRGRLDRYV